MQNPWYVKRQWRVSPSNYDPVVTSSYNFSKNIEILDTTMRDGEQQAKLFIPPAGRIQIAKQLANIGIHRIEAGTPAISKHDADAVKSIVDLHLGPKIFALARAMVEDVELAKECGVDGVVMEIPASEHLLKYGKRWTAEEAVSRAIEGTLAAKEEGLYVSFFAADASRADIEYLLDLVDQVRTNGHMNSFVFADTYGCTTPGAVAYCISRLKDRFRNLPIEVHFHEEFGLGVANTLVALSAGAEVAHTTINGVGERCGNTGYEPIVLSLKTLYGIDTGIKLEKIIETSKMFSQIAKVDVHPQRPIVGDAIMTIETGLPWSLWVNCKDEDPTVFFPYMWTMTGHSPPQTVIGKKSGKDNILSYLEELGFKANPNQVKKIVELVKEEAFKVNRILNEEEFTKIYKEVIEGK